jgi:hypothetical protein
VSIFVTGDFTQPKYPCLYNVTDPPRYPCLNNQASYLIHNLAHSRLWNYRRLPLDGLRSFVFHGNSPTLCIASGNVWWDHIDPSLRMCITPRDVHATEGRMFPVYQNVLYMHDLTHFYAQDKVVGWCLRARHCQGAVCSTVIPNWEMPYTTINVF